MPYTDQKKPIVFLYVALLVLGCTAVGRAQRVQDTLAGSRIVIAGHQDSSAEGTIELKVYPWYFERRNDVDAIIYDTTTVHGNYRFAVPAPNEYCYVSLFFKDRGDKFTPVYQYLVAAGDSVFISSKGAQFAFSGRGAAAMQCQYEAGLMNYNALTRQEIGDLQPYVGTYWFTQTVARKTDAFYAQKLAVIGRYRDSLPARMYRQLVVDCNGQKLLSRFNGYDMILSLVRDSANLATTSRYYRDSFLHTDYALYPPELMVASRTYADALAAKIILDIKLRLNHYGQLTRQPALADYCAYIRAHYTGLLRQKLLTICFIRYFEGTAQDLAVLQQYAPLVHQAYFRTILQQLQQAKLAGKPAFPFELTDTAGNTVTLRQFKNKALVMAFWFRGCPSCYHLEEYMQPVREHYRNNPDVVFISVNVDEDRQEWLAGLHDGIYSGKEEINVYTGGRGVNHPLPRFYQYQSMPQLLIIDRQHRVVSARPGAPANKDLQAAFIQLVDKGLHASP
ncbi:TlpA family protein disulfide reductase [Ilyomonas limi]|uniref:TlpA family protein disulfide reductase n=1 Tax=Ilyomonas limi TaxID=2575867 RepID=A0A4U3KQ99_9BACT|nr:TlpA disulfide reductase family protein [Ilyomonas limi]TKK64362.1 TlpA family protein disulfide reductase [Ilyomonas limi]